jgi:hypothetical protein
MIDSNVFDHDDLLLFFHRSLAGVYFHRGCIGLAKHPDPAASCPGISGSKTRRVVHSFIAAFHTSPF